MTGFPTFLINVLDIISSEETCSKLFRDIQWRNGTHCPRYGSTYLKEYGNYGEGLKRYRYKTFRRTLNAKTGTPSTILTALEGAVHTYLPL
ncbi:MAG: hypothetical protein QW279_04480 [Candidatus Jordarchaeaceae archaeon]